jgi:hypothetical protein
MSEYKKNCKDEIYWNEVNQLHEATLQISKSCFEYKKLCVGLIGASLIVLGKLTDNSLDHSYFVLPLLICMGFWIADFIAYYYQRLTRKNMNDRIRIIANDNELPDLEIKLIDVSWRKSAFNLSMSLYFVFATFSVVGWALFLNGCIG